MVIVAALLVSVASMRYSHKSLLMVGILSLLTSAIGCAFAQSYLMMLILYPLTGIGMATIQPMAMTLIAEYFPLERRARAVSWSIAGGSLAYVVGSQAIVFLARMGGWRAAYLGFVTPVILISLVLAWVGLPKASGGVREGHGSFMEGFKAVLLKGSAVSCLFATVLRLASFQLVLLYGTSFFREQFAVSRGLASTIITVVALAYTVGSLTSGRLVDKYGSKRLTLVTTFFAGFLTILMTLSTDFMVALMLDFLSAWFFGMSASVAQSLNLEQVPEFRGIMMSLNSASGGLG
jgi:predicted MFS family arabinose efflux permease